KAATDFCCRLLARTNEQEEALKRVRGRQIAPAVKKAQVAARKLINKHYKSLRDDLAAQHVELGKQQRTAITASNTAVAAEFESQAHEQAAKGVLGMVIGADDIRRTQC